jgi:hypothetical protein
MILKGGDSSNSIDTDLHLKFPSHNQMSARIFSLLLLVTTLHAQLPDPTISTPCSDLALVSL